MKGLDMFKLTIMTPERRLLINQEVDEVTVPGFKGQLNILSGHAPLITKLESGIIKWKLVGSEIQTKAVVSWGYCQVSSEGVNVLANLVDTTEEIDLVATKEFLALSEKKMLDADMSDSDWEVLQRDWARARAKIDLMDNQSK